MLPLIIALVIMGFAIFMQKMGQNIYESETSFKVSVVIFFMVYIVSAVALHFVGGNLNAPSDVSSLAQWLNDATSASAGNF